MKRNALFWSLIPAMIGASLVLVLLVLIQATKPIDDWTLSKWFQMRGVASQSASDPVSIVQLRASHDGAYRRSRDALLSLLEGLASLPSAQQPKAIVLDIALLAPPAQSAECLDETRAFSLSSVDGCEQSTEAALIESMKRLGTMVIPYQLGFEAPFPQPPPSLSSLASHSLPLPVGQPLQRTAASYAILAHPDLTPLLYGAAASAGHTNVPLEDLAGELGVFHIPLLIEVAEPISEDAIRAPLGRATPRPPRLYPSLSLAAAVVATCGPGPLERCLRIDEGRVVLQNAAGEVQARVPISFPINYRPRQPQHDHELGQGASVESEQDHKILPELISFFPDRAGGCLVGPMEAQYWRLDVRRPTASGRLGPPSDLCAVASPDLSDHVLVVIDHRERIALQNPLGNDLPPGGVHAQVIKNLLSRDFLTVVNKTTSLGLVFLLLCLSALLRLLIHHPGRRLSERLMESSSLLKARGFLLTPEPWLAIAWVGGSYWLLRAQSVWLPVSQATLGLMGGAIGWRLSLPVRLHREATKAAALIARLGAKRLELAELRSELEERFERESHLHAAIAKAEEHTHQLNLEINALDERRRAVEAGQKELTRQAEAERGRLVEQVEALKGKARGVEEDIQLLRTQQSKAEGQILREIDAALEGRPPAAPHTKLSNELIKTLGLSPGAASSINEVLEKSRRAAHELNALQKQASTAAPGKDMLSLAAALKGRWSRTINDSFQALDAATSTLTALNGLFEVKQGIKATSADIAYLQGLGIDTQDKTYAAYLRRCLASFSKRNKVIYIHGEMGTGKSMLASIIHRVSQRPGHFETFDAGMEKENPQLIAARLAGYWKGAFLGASRDTQGVLERCDGGTVFIDEVAELPPNVQSMLLTTLSSGEITPLGHPPKGVPPSKKVDVRFLIATNRDLQALAESGDFRLDLYHRLAELKITLKPLRERPGDIPLLVRETLRCHSKRERPGDTPPTVHPLVMSAMTGWFWAGNVRSIIGFVENLAETAWFRGRQGLETDVIVEPGDLSQVLQDVPYDPRSGPKDSEAKAPLGPPASNEEDIRIFGKRRAYRLQIYRRHGFLWCEDTVLKQGVKFSDDPKRPAEATFYYDLKRCYVDALLEAEGDPNKGGGSMGGGGGDQSVVEQLAKDMASWFRELMATVDKLGVDLSDANWGKTEAGIAFKDWLHKELKEQRAERRAVELAGRVQGGGWSLG